MKNDRSRFWYLPLLPSGIEVLIIGKVKLAKRKPLIEPQRQSQKNTMNTLQSTSSNLENLLNPYKALLKPLKNIPANPFSLVKPHEDPTGHPIQKKNFENSAHQKKNEVLQVSQLATTTAKRSERHGEVIHPPFQRFVDDWHNLHLSSLRFSSGFIVVFQYILVIK